MKNHNNNLTANTIKTKKFNFQKIKKYIPIIIGSIIGISVPLLVKYIQNNS